MNLLEHNFSIQSPNLLIHWTKCWRGFCMLSDKKAFGWTMCQACTAYFIAWPVVHWWPLNVSLSGSKRCQSTEVKFGLYTGCSKTSNFSCCEVSTVWANDCGQVLSSNNTTPVNSNFGICCELLASSCPTACHTDEHCLLLNPLHSTGPCKSQKSVRIPFPAVCCVLNIFFTGDVGYFHSRLWHLFYGSE